MFDDSDEERRQRAIERLQSKYPYADRETLHRYLDLKEEGYSTTQALLMSGLEDPDSIEGQR
jgi:hypothetical protein